MIEIEIKKMDIFVQNLLINNGLEMYVEKFKEQCIGEESLMQLEPAELKDLVPIIGHLAKLRSLISQQKSNISVSVNAEKRLSNELNCECKHLSPSSPSCSSSSSDDTLPISDYEKLRSFDVAKLIDLKEPSIYHLLEEKKGLDRLQKNCLARHFVEKLIELFGHYMKKEVMLAAAKKIADTYLDLRPYQLWYLPASKCSPSSGLLDQRLKNWRKKLSPHDKKILKRAELPETLNADSEGEHSQNWKLWLQENESPADLVQEKWHLSFGHRRNDIKDLHTTQVLEQWPCLLKSEWINEDFRALIPTAIHDGLDVGLDKFAKELFTKLPDLKRAAAIEEFAKLKQLISESDPETSESAALLLLPLVLPQGNVVIRKGSKKVSIRPSSEMTKSQFIEEIPEGSNLQEVISNNKEKERRQPFIVSISGENRLKPSIVKIICCDKVISCSSLIKAVDTLFKLYFVLDLKYPVYCKNTYLFMEYYFYKIASSNTGVVREFLSNF